MFMNIFKKLAHSFVGNEVRTILNWKKLVPVNRFPHGHFYSPIVSQIDLKQFERQIWNEENNKFIDGVELNTEAQLCLLENLKKFYKDLPFRKNAINDCRYYYENASYGYTDAIILYSFIRHYRPQRIIEIGSGYSSAVMLDTRELFCKNLELTFIEPYPKLLYSLFKNYDRENCKVYESKVQNVDLNVFQTLEENDILFIDSSHVSKTGSDVNFEFFKILPSLKSGVIIHFHDIFFPFEYPPKWVNEGRNWNEAYLLRAFLNYNNAFEILHFSNYLHKHHSGAFKEMPLAYKNKGGNIWIRKK